MFTHLLLLKKGGHTVYFGPIGEKPGDFSYVLDYFADLGFTCPPHKNPAGSSIPFPHKTKVWIFLISDPIDFILEHSGAGLSNHTTDQPNDEPAENGEDGEEEDDEQPQERDEEKAVDEHDYDFVAAFQQSKLFTELQDELAEGVYRTEMDAARTAHLDEKEQEEREANGEEDEDVKEDSSKGEGEDKEDGESGDEIPAGYATQAWRNLREKLSLCWRMYRSRYATPFYSQMWYLFMRRLKSYWRDTGGLILKFVRAIVMVS